MEVFGAQKLLVCSPQLVFILLWASRTSNMPVDSMCMMFAHPETDKTEMWSYACCKVFSLLVQ